jgi:hypothetical protein
MSDGRPLEVPDDVEGLFAQLTEEILGMPGKYTLRLGELEEANPSEPLHVERGYARDESPPSRRSACRERKAARHLAWTIRASAGSRGELLRSAIRRSPIR